MKALKTRRPKRGCNNLHRQTFLHTQKSYYKTVGCSRFPNLAGVFDAILHIPPFFGPFPVKIFKALIINGIVLIKKLA